MADTVAVHQPRCHDNSHIQSEIVGDLRISQHSPTDHDVERKERQRASCDDYHQHDNSLFSELQPVRADLHHVRFAKTTIAVLSAVLQSRLDPLDGDGMETYHERQRDETKNKCLNYNIHFPSLRRWPILDAKRNSTDLFYSSVTETHRWVNDSNDPSSKNEIADFGSLGTHFKRKVNHKELLHADDEKGHNGGIYGRVLQKGDKFATDHPKDPPFRDKCVNCENRNAEYCDENIGQAETEDRKVRRTSP